MICPKLVLKNERRQFLFLFLFFFLFFFFFFFFFFLIFFLFLYFFTSPSSARSRAQCVRCEDGLLIVLEPDKDALGLGDGVPSDEEVVNQSRIAPLCRHLLRVIELGVDVQIATDGCFIQKEEEETKKEEGRK